MLMVCCFVVLDCLNGSLGREIGMECPLLFSKGLDDFLMMMGWATSSSTFFSGGRMAECILRLGAVERVGFFSKSKSI